MNFQLTDFLEISQKELCLSPSPLSTTGGPVLACTRILPVAGSSHELSTLEQGVAEYEGNLQKSFPIYHAHPKYQAAGFWRGSAVLLDQ